METTKSSYRLPDALIQKLDQIAEQQKTSRTDVIVAACQMYLDQQAAQAPGSYLPQWAVQQIQGLCGDLQTQLNSRSNQLLSSMAIQLTVMQMILADSLEVGAASVEEYTAQAVDSLRKNNRIFRMEEIMR